MAVGLLIGPSGLGLLDKHTLTDPRILVDIALALNPCWSFILFAAVVPALLLDQQASISQVVLQPAYLLLGSALLGASIGFLLHWLCLRTAGAEQYKFALVVGALMLTLALAQQLKLSALFAPLVVGITVRSLERQQLVSELQFGQAFELFFIVLFVFAGAKLQLDTLWQYGSVVLLLVLVRSSAKLLGVSAIALWHRRPARPALASGVLLIPMAGLAIGLAQTSAGLTPEHAAVITAIVLGAVTVFETIGPPLAALAFRLAGEAGQLSAGPLQGTLQGTLSGQATSCGQAGQSQQAPQNSWQVPGAVPVDISAFYQPPLTVPPTDVPSIITTTDRKGAEPDAVSQSNSPTKLSRLFSWRRSRL